MPIAEIEGPDGSLFEIEYPEGATDEEILSFIEQNQDADISFGAGIRDPRPEVPEWKQKVSGNLHTTLPAVGGMAGSLLGGGGAIIAGNVGPQIATPEELLTVPLAVVEGGAIGATAGDNFADVIDEWMGVTPKRDWPETVSNTAQNAREAITGEGIGLGLPPALNAAKKVVTGTKNLIPSGQRVISDFYKNAVQPKDAANIARAEKVKSVLPDYQTTPGMLTSNRDITGMERGAVASPDFTGMNGQIEDLQQGNIQAIKSGVNNLVDGNADDFVTEIGRQKSVADAQRRTLGQVDPQQTGTQFAQTLDDAKKPVQATMEELKNKIPDYPMDATNFKKTAAQINADKMTNIEARKLVRAKTKELNDTISKDGGTTHTLIGFRKGLNDTINELPDGEKKTALIKLKAAIDEDFVDLSAKARTGQLKVHEGKVYRPDDLAKTLEEKTTRLAEMQTQQSPDIDGMMKELDAQRNGLMRMTAESEEQHTKRVLTAYQNKFGTIKTIGGNAQEMEKLLSESKNIRELLGKLQPGQDVAALYNAYNKYASSKYFKRFKTQSIKRATHGNTNTENITRIFNNPTGANELIEAIGPEEAKTMMRQHYQADFSKLLESNPSDQTITNWYKKNIRTMQKFGLNKEFSDTVRTQVGYHNAEKILQTDINSLFEKLFSGQRQQQEYFINSTLKKIGGNTRARDGLKKAFTDFLEDKMIIQKAGDDEGFGRVNALLESMQPTINKLFSAQEKQSLYAIQDAVKIQQNWLKGNSLGNSITSEITQKQATRIIGGRKVNPIIEVMIGTLSGAAGYKAGGVTAATIAPTAVATVRESIRRHGNNVVRAAFQRATFDPSYAKVINALAKEKPTKAAIAQFSDIIAYQAGRFSALGILNKADHRSQE